MQRLLHALLAGIVSVAGCLTAGTVGAASTGAVASAFVSGKTVKQETTGGPTGANAAASQLIPSTLGHVRVNAQASSQPGSLGASADAATDGAPGGFQGQAKATWSDAFIIASPGHGSSETGLFSGSVFVSGELLASYHGRVYVGSQVGALVDLFPDTGYNGGRTTVGGFASYGLGYDIPGGHTGTEGFALQFVNVPFTFGRPINVTVSLSVTADVNAIDAGVTGRAQASYGHTLVWSGLDNVRDHAGARLTSYTALSADSGYNFAPVPEPGGLWLMLGGGLVLAMCARTRLRR